MISPITMSVADGIATLVLDVADKPMNVITPELRTALGEAVDQISKDAVIKGVIITSGKADFMAGGDLKAMLRRFDQHLSGPELYEQSRQFGDLLRRLETCGKPVVAAIKGLALGGGFELALACHYRVVADLPKILVGLPEATLGLMPGAGGTQRVTRMLGVAAALPILLEGKTFSPVKALEAKLVDAVVPENNLLEVARAWITNVGDPVQRWDKKDYKVPGGSTLGAAPLGPLYNVMATGLARDTQRNRPAPIAIVTAVARGIPLPIDAGLRVERREFVKLLMNPVTRNLIRTQFVSKGEAEKLARRPQGVPVKDYTKIGVLGAGLMGSGIAQVAALSGIDVVLLDASQDNAENGRARLAATFDKLIGRGKMDKHKAEAALARITATADYGLLAGAQLVIEAVFEDRDVKTNVLKTAHAVLGDDVIYASNTSTIPVTGLAAAVNRADRFIGMHFFSPVDRMALVEVVKGKKTSEKTMAHALDFVKRIRKTPIVVNDSRGFFTSRVFSSYLSEAMGMLAEGIDPALVENGAKLAGFPVGPLTLIDEVTIELGFSAANQARRDLGEAWVQPPGYPVQKIFCETLDRKGRRYGKGFYDYPENAPKKLWKGLAEVFLRKAVQPSIEEVKQRLLYIQALEATRCLDQGVIESVAEGDVGSTLGIGYPAWTGGVFSLIDTVGLAKFVEICERFAHAYGERWRPSEALKAQAAAGASMYPKEGSSNEAIAA
jgi:3-hydroxyacyl-CoA dehydrogenase/enoyl-CoA hydratase/3-hydroxybutyryl-CoA epimerase